MATRPSAEPPRLHPDSWRDLIQLVKLHGSAEIIAAVHHIEKNAAPRVPPLPDTFEEIAEMRGW